MMKRYNGEQILCYDTPAESWNAALPLGNGKIGAMVYGGIQKEILAMNYDELWSGHPNDNPGDNVRPYMEEAKKALLAGNKPLAHQIITEHAKRGEASDYMPFGNVELMFRHGSASNYYRDLDLRTAISRVTYEADGGKYEREYLISYPDNAMAVSLKAKGALLNFDVTMTSPMMHKTKTENGVLLLDGVCFTYARPAEHPNSGGKNYSDTPIQDGISYRGAVKVWSDGNISLQADCLTVSNATYATLYFTVESSFNGFDKDPYAQGKEYTIAPITVLNAVSGKTYDEVKKTHLEDYRNLYERVSFTLGQPDAENPTDKRLLMQKDGPEDLGLEVLLFNFGRYLTIASSRAGSEATNLQGIWNDSVCPPWRSDYTANINTQMNYYPTLAISLPECYEPLLRKIKDISVAGEKTASAMYGARGFVSHHNIDIWCKTTPTGGNPRWFFFPMSSGWFCRHIFDYYLYTKDETYLRTDGFPLMKKAASFYLDLLTEDPDGYLIFSPATSPENVFRAEGKECAVALTSTMSMSIITELFQNVLKAAKILGQEKDVVVQEVRDAYPRLLPFRVAKDGSLIEWYEEEEEVEPEHRHVSHLYGLHPGKLISPTSTPELANACRKTLQKRGDGGTGWSLSWKLNMWARLLDGDHAHLLLRNQLNPIPASLEHIIMGGGGTYPNLFDAHPPFQIDGNFGTVSGIVEMLMQCDEKHIYILPALPSAWKEGSIKGLTAMGNIKVDITWKNGMLTDCHTEGKTQGIKIIYKGMEIA